MEFIERVLAVQKATRFEFSLDLLESSGWHSRWFTSWGAQEGFKRSKRML